MTRELLADVLALLRFVEVEFSHELDLDTGECPAECKACQVIAQSPVWTRWLSHGEYPIRETIERVETILRGLP